MGQLHLGRLFGVPIVAAGSWLIWLFAALYIVTGFFPTEVSGGDGRAFGLAIVVVTIYVVALLGHEFGHALMARRLGIETERVELWMLGGLAHLSRGARTPKEEFLIAAAGPAVTFVFAAGALVVVGLVDGFALRTLWQIGSLQYSGSTPAGAVAGIILFVEGLALIFNLLPAMPLDGGRIARSIVWKATGDQRRGTAVTAQAGKGLAILLVFAAVALLVRTDSLFNAAMALFLAWFIWENAKAMVPEADRARRQAPSAIRADAVMDAAPVWVGVSDGAADADAQAFAGHDLDWAVVLEPDGRLRGIVTRERVAEELAAGRPATPAAELVAPGRRPSTREDVLLHKLLKDKDLERLGALPVVDARGTVVGVVAREDARQAYVVEGGLRS